MTVGRTLRPEAKYHNSGVQQPHCSTHHVSPAATEAAADAASSRPIPRILARRKPLLSSSPPPFSKTSYGTSFSSYSRASSLHRSKLNESCSCISFAATFPRQCTVSYIPPNDCFTALSCFFTCQCPSGHIEATTSLHRIHYVLPIRARICLTQSALFRGRSGEGNRYRGW